MRQWDPSREFYVILDGTAEVQTADGNLPDPGQGDYFDELAPLDRGASFG